MNFKSDEGVTMTFEANVMPMETFKLLTGGDALPGSASDHPPLPTVSVLIETTATVSGAPQRPTFQRGFKAWITRANAKAMRAYDAEWRAWDEAGRPDREVLICRFIPRARITS